MMSLGHLLTQMPCSPVISLQANTVRASGNDIRVGFGSVRDLLRAAKALGQDASRRSAARLAHDVAYTLDLKVEATVRGTRAETIDAGRPGNVLGRLAGASGVALSPPGILRALTPA